MYGKQCWPWSDATFHSIWFASTLFAKAYLSQYLGLLQYAPSLRLLQYLSDALLQCCEHPEMAENSWWDVTHLIYHYGMERHSSADIVDLDHKDAGQTTPVS